LVYVGSSSGDNETRLFINDPENVPTPAYLTLSYCWGKKEFPCLTKETLETFIERIDVNALPATLREAIQVTRHLGYSYIWIDALCILQDSKEDWQTESIKMGSIYRTSILTIAAMGAPSVFHGLFMSRNPLCYQDLQLSNSKFAFSARAGDVDPRFKREFEVLGPAASPLQTRAWCVQEELLAPRTLFFGASGLFWQYTECEADEGYPVGSKHGDSHNLKREVMQSLAAPDVEVRGTWRSILRRYTGGKLTYASDKLVAISGLAQLLARAKGEEYVAGMWKRDVFHDLLWYSLNGQWKENRTL
jgi:hypothetical protein